MRGPPAATAMAIQERILDGSSIRQIMGEFWRRKGHRLPLSGDCTEPAQEGHAAT